MVQNGKFALCALALESELKRVDLPTLGSPTIPAFIYINFAIRFLPLKVGKGSILNPIYKVRTSYNPKEFA
ncbi:hypothetical protein GCM10010832_08500 [Psychroflexus planctonicus]|uniref:Uncharacterized protein n=1 Tax=Psychroflexus planctonicus TaxID=1526575 RepID=A0ABQ1SH49_9FLAO|nr:hypothetical protein GCM10010832_08500 [Psychroflexus planctonicus]